MQTVQQLPKPTLPYQSHSHRSYKKLIVNWHCCRCGALLSRNVPHVRKGNSPKVYCPPCFESLYFVAKEDIEDDA
jgi:hypothetical protein